MTEREAFLFDCVMLGDLTPFSGIMTEADAIFVSAALCVKEIDVDLVVIVKMELRLIGTGQ